MYLKPVPCSMSISTGHTHTVLKDAGHEPNMPSRGPDGQVDAWVSVVVTTTAHVAPLCRRQAHRHASVLLFMFVSCFVQTLCETGGTGTGGDEVGDVLIYHSYKVLIHETSVWSLISGACVRVMAMVLVSPRNKLWHSAPTPPGPSAPAHLHCNTRKYQHFRANNDNHRMEGSKIDAHVYSWARL